MYSCIHTQLGTCTVQVASYPGLLNFFQRTREKTEYEATQVVLLCVCVCVCETMIIRDSDHMYCSLEEERILIYRKSRKLRVKNISWGKFSC